jgi:hypothetical protein
VQGNHQRGAAGCGEGVQVTHTVAALSWTWLGSVRLGTFGSVRLRSSPLRCARLGSARLGPVKRVQLC